MTRRNTIHAVTLVGIVVIILVSFAIKVSIFKECRDAGFSRLYCIMK